MNVIDIKKQYNILDALHEILYNVLVHGEDTTKDDETVMEYLGNYICIRNPFPECYEGSNELSYREKFIRAIEDGRFDLEHYGIKGIALAEYVKSLDNDNIVHLTSRDDFVYTYPNRIKSQFMNGVYSNQLRTIINRLSTCDGTNRAVATIYNPLLDERINDIPCLQWIQCTIRNDKLRIHCMFRSNDIYGAWYSNMLFLTYLAFEIIEMLEERNIFVTFDGIEYHSTSAHIYKKDIDDAIKLFKEVGAA